MAYCEIRTGMIREVVESWVGNEFIEEDRYIPFVHMLVYDRPFTAGANDILLLEQFWRIRL